MPRMKSVKKAGVKKPKKTVKAPVEKAGVKKPVKIATKKEQVIKAAREKAAAKAKAINRAESKKSSKKEDTGSCDFQIQNFTEKIEVLSKHLKAHPHDFDSRRGLLIMVGKRRRLLNYLKKSDPASYEKYTGKLKLKA